MTTRLLLAALIAASSIACATAQRAAPAGTPAATKSEPPASGAASKGAASADAAPAAPKGGSPVARLQVPLMAESSASIPIAKVGDEIIRLDELLQVLAATHESHAERKGVARDFRAALDRLVDARLVALEARAMGLDELPEIAKAIEGHEFEAATSLLKAQVVRDVRPDAAAVEAAYAQAIKAPKIRALRFEKAADAAAASKLLQGGKPFAEVAAQAVAEKKATEDGKAEPLPAEGVRPEVAAALANAKAGASTAPIPVENGFAILHVEEIVSLEDAAKKIALAKQSLTTERQKAMRAYYKTLVEKYATVDTKLLARLDFHAKKPGFAALAKDRRALARIKGEDPITVADLAQAMRLKYFHGMDGPIRDKQLNPLKEPLLEDTLARRLFLKEARAQNLDQTDAYRLDMTAFTTGLLVSKFTEQAIAPEAKVSESAMKAYYDGHQSEYTYPAFYGIEAISFKTRKAAQSALDKAKAGTDLKWIRANAEDVVAPDDSSVEFPAAPLAASTMPPDLLKVVQGAGVGDLRIFEYSGQFHVLNVVSFTPPRPQEFKDCREPIAKKLFAEGVGKKMKDWIAKLRAAHEVTVYLTEIGS